MKTTSQQAREKVDTATLRQQCLEEIGASHAGLTADECAQWLGVDILSIRPRFTELYKAGQIQRTGTRRKNSKGNLQYVYAAAQPAKRQQSFL